MGACESNRASGDCLSKLRRYTVMHRKKKKPPYSFFRRNRHAAGKLTEPAEYAEGNLVVTFAPTLCTFKLIFVG